MMNLEEEEAAFFYAIGKCIGQWSYIEAQLRGVALECFSFPDRPTAESAYSAVENFRSRLNLIDAVIYSKHGKSKIYTTWGPIKVSAERLSQKRNKIAHYLCKLYVHAPSGRCFVLVPFEQSRDAPTRRSKKIEDGLHPPHGCLCVKDLAAIRKEFHALTVKLAMLRHLITGRPVRPEEFDDKPDEPMHLEQLNLLRRHRKIHALRAKRRAPSSRSA